MCGVVAFHSNAPREQHVLMLVDLFKHSRLRGTHASGFAVPAKDGSIYVKRSTSFENTLLDLLRYRRYPFSSLIGHTRYSTSGDWRTDANNQPLIGKRYALAFNGVISQASKREREQLFGKRYSTDNDGEIVLRMAEDAEPWFDFVQRGPFSFAGALLERSGVVLVGRNAQRPLWTCRVAGAVFVASTADIFLRALRGWDVANNLATVPLGSALNLADLL